MGTTKHGFTRQETIRDIYDYLFYVIEVKAAPQHDIYVHYGQYVTDPKTIQIIMTPNLVEFIKATLDWKKEAFNLPFSYKSLQKFRCILQRNPYNSYKQWLENSKRPAFVTFDQSVRRPEKVEDIDGQTFILYSAEMSTPLSIPILRGHNENKFNSSTHGNPEFILTPELRKVIIDYEMKYELLLSLLPFKKSCLQRFFVRLKQETIRDIYGNLYSVAKIKPVPQYDLHIYYGRLIVNGIGTYGIGASKIVATSELLTFIKKTLDWKKEAFKPLFAYNYLRRLRLSLQYSQYDSYKRWLADPKRPDYVTFNYRNRPEIIEDVDGEKFILYSAEMSGLSIPVLRGYQQSKKLDYKNAGIIFTFELRKVIAEYRMEPEVLLPLMPFKKCSLDKFRRRLNYRVVSKINNFLVERLDDLVTLAPLEFHKKFPDFIGIKAIYNASSGVKKILAIYEKNSTKNTELLALLEEYWLTDCSITKEATATKKKLDEYFGSVAKSKQHRRAYNILKLAGRI